MKLDELTLGEVKQLKCMFGETNKEGLCCEQDLGKKIVVLQRGWVAIGDYIKSGEYVTLKNAAIIRKWGTTKGLPQLAREGKLSDTVLDSSPNIKFHILTEVMSIDCCEEKWKD